MKLGDLEKHSPADWLYDLRDQLKRHVYDRSEAAFARGDAARDAIRTPARLARRQRAARRFFIDCLGGLPSSRTPLNARTTGTVRGKGFTVEKVIFESQPNRFVTANLYLPDRRRRRTGALLYICGHAITAKHDRAYQEIFQAFVHAGLIVLAQDPEGQGERLGYYDPSRRRFTVKGPTAEHEHAGTPCLLLGDGTARYFLHDAMRGIDYLLSRPGVDPRRIGVSGESGGGTHTSMLMLADPRIAAAAPALFLTSRRHYMLTGGAQDAEQIWRGFTAAGFDHEDVLLAFAPRPLRLLSAAYDFFPIEGTRRTVARCRRFWRLCGRPSNLDMVELPCQHSYPPAMLRAAVDFFSRHLLGFEPAPEPIPASPLAPSAVWCTRSGQVRGEIAGARFVHDANRERLRGIESRRAPARRRRAPALAWLRRRVMAGRKPGALNPRTVVRETVGELQAESLMWWSQEGILNHGMLFRSRRFEGHSLPVTLAVWDGGTTALRPHGAWIRRQCRARRAVLVLNVTGAGAIAPNPVNGRPVQAVFGTLHKFADDLAWLDDDLAALRTFDVLRALDLIAERPGLLAADIRVYAHGTHGLYGQLAAALDPRIRRIAVAKGIGSFARLVRSRRPDERDIKSVILHDVLNHFDLGDLRAWRNERRVSR